MEPIIINATDLRNKTRDLMERVKYHGDIFLVETFGRPMAVIMSVEEFAALSQAPLLISHRTDRKHRKRNRNVLTNRRVTRKFNRTIVNGKESESR